DAVAVEVSDNGRRQQLRGRRVADRIHGPQQAAIASEGIRLGLAVAAGGTAADDDVEAAVIVHVTDGGRHQRRAVEGDGPARYVRAIVEVDGLHLRCLRARGGATAGHELGPAVTVDVGDGTARLEDGVEAAVPTLAAVGVDPPQHAEMAALVPAGVAAEVDLGPAVTVGVV